MVESILERPSEDTRFSRLIETLSGRYAKEIALNAGKGDEYRSAKAGLFG